MYTNRPISSKANKMPISLSMKQKKTRTHNICVVKYKRDVRTIRIKERNCCNFLFVRLFLNNQINRMNSFSAEYSENDKKKLIRKISLCWCSNKNLCSFVFAVYKRNECSSESVCWSERTLRSTSYETTYTRSNVHNVCCYTD